MNNSSRSFFAAIFIPLCFGFILYQSYRGVQSWLAVPNDHATVTFDGDDTKLMFTLAVLVPILLYFAVRPQAFRRSSGQQALKLGFKECMIIGVGIAGLLSLPRLLFADGYLESAEAYSRQHGYAFICDETDYKYFRKLTMAKTRADCGS